MPWRMAKIGLGNSMPSVLKFANIMKTLWYLIIFGSAITENYNSVFWNTNPIENKTQVRQMVDFHLSKRVLINIGIFK